MNTAVLRAAQALDTDPLVELWELDLSPITNVYGQSGVGLVYRWTPGILNYRHTGTLLAVTTSQVTLDQHLTLENSALNYTVQAGVASDPSSFTNQTKIAGFGTTVVDGNTVTTAGLSHEFGDTVVAGAPFLIESLGSVWFDGSEYLPAPIELTGMEWSGQGKLPRPVLRVSNIGGLAGALVAQFGDIVGARVTRLQTFKSFLDGEATPDPSAIFEPEIFVIDRKSAHNKNTIEFELAADFDQQGIRLPKRLVMRDSCDQTYRQWSDVSGTFVYGSCPYSGAMWFKADGTAALVPQDDVCGKHVSDCILRFGDSVRLPMRAFPGVAEVRG